MNPKSKECKFCKALKERKQIHDFLSKKDPEDPELGPYLHDYKVALVIRSWYKKRGKKSASRTVDFRSQGLGYDLNYCPECGKELNEK